MVGGVLGVVSVLDGKHVPVCTTERAVVPKKYGMDLRAVRTEVCLTR